MSDLPENWLRPLGSTGLTVSALCAGGGPLGSMPGTAGSTRYAYREAPPGVLDAVRGMEETCLRYGVSLGAAAVQFSVRDPRIASTIVGFSKPERVDDAVAQATTPIADELWPELERFVPAPENWLY
jgi:D-threo-aldose 1-dehydrogenase